ncbi:LytTR family transcriptional regulator DNA-binding domain-containing protein [Paenibacillus sp. MCAF20]
MHTLTVTRDPEGESGIYNLAVDAADFMECESDKKRILVHTELEVFYMFGTLKYWQKLLNNSGYRFADVDRNLLVNVANVTLLDSDKKEAYFNSEQKKISKKCGIAWHKYSQHEALIRSFNPHVKIV